MGRGWKFWHVHTGDVASDGTPRGCCMHCMGTLSLERPTMILYGIDDIRDLLGPKVDLWLIKRKPICRIGINY
ncbi:hypothetical protein C5167_025557 [Papaver somniferum]|uniref:Phenylalanyl-tRNA synthetase domain-containing protein n=1 Tax=Papaver somniferum TaxID=3469 RepID=A0A4Y7JUT7_PAPSO|nr:hypothetical protein C5167_025557 [Papaver somniferum]